MRSNRNPSKGARQKQDFRVNNLNSSKSFIQTELDLAIIERNKVLSGNEILGRERGKTNNLTHLSSYLADNGSSSFPIILLRRRQLFAFFQSRRRSEKIRVLRQFHFQPFFQFSTRINFNFSSSGNYSGNKKCK